MGTLADFRTRADEDVREDIGREFEWDPQITSTDIAVAVNDNVVELSGFVSSLAEKDAAERAAKRVRGVRGVANDLQVTPASMRNDPEILREVLEHIGTHVFVSPQQITATVRDGWVALEGTVDWQYQRRLAESGIQTLRGVRGVTNRVVIKPRVDVTDVKMKIEEALKRSAEVDADHITVDADGTLIRLSGTVGSWIEKDAAEQAAWAAPGVSQVDNRIRIEP